MIDVSNLYKSFGQNHVLKGVSLKVQDGKSMVIIGASGQGKSVILKCLLGLTKPNSGKILLNGVDPNSAQKNIILSKVGMLFQGGALFDSLPIWQNVAFRYLHGKQKINASEARKIAVEKLERVGLKKSFADNFPSELSGGMQRRLMVARALIHKPKLLILDEPTAGADVEVRRLMWDYLKFLNENGTTIILTTHYLEEAENLCKNIAIIDDGKILRNSSMRNFLNELKSENLILYTENPLKNDFSVEGLDINIIDENTCEVSVSVDSSINFLIEELSKKGVKVKSLKNKTSRLEELFISMVDKNGK